MTGWLSPGAGDFITHLAGGLGVEIVDYNPCSSTRHRQGIVVAKAATRTGDDGVTRLASKPFIADYYPVASAARCVSLMKSRGDLNQEYDHVDRCQPLQGALQGMTVPLGGQVIAHDTYEQGAQPQADEVQREQKQGAGGAAMSRRYVVLNNGQCRGQVDVGEGIGPEEKQQRVGQSGASVYRKRNGTTATGESCTSA